MQFLKWSFAGFLFWAAALGAQQPAVLSLEECQRLVRDYYPALQRLGLNDQVSRLRLEQWDAQRLPSVSWNGKATYQSEAVRVPFQVPGREPIEQPRFNGQTTLEVNYLVYDGGLSEANKQLEKAQLAATQQSVEVELSQLKERVNRLYFGILLVRAQDSILANTQSDLEARLRTLEAGERHGVVLPSEVSKLRVEILRLGSRREELTGQERSLLASLGAFIHQDLSVGTRLSIPKLPPVGFSEDARRPELALFDRQQQQILAAAPLIEARQRPKVNAFFQGGVGYANPLNFFDTDLSPFAVAGVQFRWNFWDWGQARRDREILTVQSQVIENQRETFLYNLALIDGQYAEEARKTATLIEQDRAIAALQEEIIAQTGAQLEHGVITATEYLTQINAGIQAQLNLRLHELQLAQLKTDYLTQKGIW